MFSHITEFVNSNQLLTIILTHAMLGMLMIRSAWKITMSVFRRDNPLLDTIEVVIVGCFYACLVLIFSVAPAIILTLVTILFLLAVGEIYFRRSK